MNSVDRSYKNNKDYYIIFGLILLVFILSINTDLAEYSQHQSLNIPRGFFYYTLGVDFLVLFSWLLILFFRKLGVVLFPVFVLLHFSLHNYFLSTYLYSDITVLFLFVGIGLIAVIPRWNILK
ncbi:hypothetical protein [Epilithonimonas arachidiradicis]|uniref:DoxX-like protein n=1 Tax=Epilithonimonas arachidiradicis TaxID=1617282 RepID=A0A420DCG2_9FLAO|nr:hypothetical protein [Epilithonimonas arachidiradicis]RKE88937.1 hypothetical protein BXY58_1070 [Epilithonimonas arachidiradicis]GGG53846.1 hypothetical protein GCM10007332_14410 [Epilithonimonas arachidiradicis]